MNPERRKAGRTGEGVEKMATPVIDALNKFLAMGFGLRESCQLTDKALGLKLGTARAVLVGGVA
jgi:hypothetical protein